MNTNNYSTLRKYVLDLESLGYDAKKRRDLFSWNSLEGIESIIAKEKKELSDHHFSRAMHSLSNFMMSGVGIMACSVGSHQFDSEYLGKAAAGFAAISAYYLFDHFRLWYKSSSSRRRAE